MSPECGFPGCRGNGVDRAHVHRDYSAAQIMAGISAALRAGDMQAADDLMPLLAVKDPASAQMILDALELMK